MPNENTYITMCLIMRSMRNIYIITCGCHASTETWCICVYEHTCRVPRKSFTVEKINISVCMYVIFMCICICHIYVYMYVRTGHIYVYMCKSCLYTCVCFICVCAYVIFMRTCIGISTWKVHTKFYGWMVFHMYVCIMVTCAYA